MEQSTLQIMGKRYFIGPVLLLSLVVGSIIVCRSRIPDEVLFPNAEHYNCNGYTDAVNGGNSKILNFSANDSVIHLHYILHDAFQSPYVGISINPTIQTSINLSRYNEIQLQIKGEKINRVGVALYTPPLPQVKTGKEDETIYHVYQAITSEVSTYHIPFRELKHPEWWEDIHQISSPSNLKPMLNEVLHFNISSAFAPDIQSPKTLEVYSIRLIRNNTRLFWGLALGYVFVVAVYLLLLYRTSNRKQKTREVTVAYKPVTSEPQPEEKWLEYINHNFQNNELSLELVAGETNTSPRRITQLMQEKFQCNFKTYINGIRITEAKRLLTETPLNIGEVAFKVGFNNQSHFNRVFKAAEQMNPSEYREKHA